MKARGLAVALVAGHLMALPTPSSAITDCSYVSSGAITVYTTGGRGDSAKGDSIVGVCVDVNGLGGYAEAGQSDNGADTYAIVDGSDANPGLAAGYAGVDNGAVTDTSKDADCDGADTAAPSYNSGGCVWIKPAPAAVNNAIQNVTVTEMLVCGSTEGPDWANSPRDGCSLPADACGGCSLPPDPRTCSGAEGVDVVNGPTAVHACVNVNGIGGEAVVAKDGSYGWIDLWPTNPGSPAYAGFNNGGIAETGSKDSDCDGVDAGSGSNSGGCFWIKGLPTAVNQALQNPVTAMLICGDTSGEDPRNTNRDGCSIPDVSWGRVTSDEPSAGSD